MLEKYYYADLIIDEAEMGKIPYKVIMPMSNLFSLLNIDETNLAITNIGL